MNKIIKFTISLSFILLTLCSACTTPKPKDNEKIKGFIARCELGKDREIIGEARARTAIELAAALTPKYELYNQIEIDSAIKSMRDKKIMNTSLNVAKELNADRIIFARFSKLANLIRCELKISTTDKDTGSGIGWATIRYQRENIDTLMLEPSLLEASQRAFSAAIGDSEVYKIQAPKYNIKPVPPLVIGSIRYYDDEIKTNWNLFKERIVSSYDAVSTICDEAMKSPRFVTIDITTRDSIYALNKEYIVENYNAPSIDELKPFYYMGIKNLILGEFKPVQEGAELTLYLFEIEKDKLQQIKIASDLLKKDDVEEFRKLLKKLTDKLLE